MYIIRGDYLNKCIYYKNGNGLTYTKKEHIISAGLGGTKKLELGIVSNQANEQFSRMELDVLRKSPIGLIRAFLGPGKRGTLSENKRTKSDIHVIHECGSESAELGYIELGKPKSISQIRIDKSNNITFEFDKYAGDMDIQFSQLILKLSTFDFEYKAFKNENVKEDISILGYFEGKWYMFFNDEKWLEKWKDIIPKLLSGNFEKSDSGEQSYQCKNYMYMHFKIDFIERFIAKTAFNTFAYLYSHERALDDEFDNLRNWIINGGENLYVKPMSGHNTVLNEIGIPDYAHTVLISKIKGGNIIAQVCIYGENFPNYVVLLAKEYSKPIMPNVFICDWKNRIDNSLTKILASKSF